MAHYAEHGGDMEVPYAGTTECPQCGGRGILEFQGAVGGNTVRVTCPLCHKTRFLRSIRFW
jgi:DnaJ-class molecular chaperone